MSVTVCRRQVRDLAQRIAAFESFFRNEGRGVAGSGELHRRVRLVLARQVSNAAVGKAARLVRTGWTRAIGGLRSA